MLYKREEIPEDLRGRGVFVRFGGEVLFSPFGGNTQVVGTDWTCQNCGSKWYYHDVIANYNAHCPRCGKWVGIKGLKFNGVQKHIEEFVR